MNLSRREFLQLMAAAGAAGLLPGAARAADPYDLPAFGNVGLLHYTDCHAQLLPVHYREPNVNLGIGDMKGRPPHLVGNHLLEHFGIAPGSAEAHAFTYLDFPEAAQRFGKVGGFAHLATLVKRLRAERPGSVLLDGGDTWQGSATSLWSNAQDMVDAQLALGVDIMTSHWEMTFGAERVTEIIENDFAGKIDFVAQNVLDTTWEEPVFPAFTTREINGVPVAIIGQAFPYTPIANPRYMVPDWSFGIREERMQQTVDEARDGGAQVVVVLSHNGTDPDLKMASRVRGIDAIMGGHTHDAIPKPIEVANPGGTTLVINSGSNAKFLSVLDFDVRNGKVRDYRFHQLPVFSNLLPADPEMTAVIERHRAPYREKLAEPLAVADSLLYRRGNFNGTFDQVICDALMATQDAPIALSPGFRWGTTLLPGETITFEDLMTQTAITYPTVTVNEFTGEFLKTILEDVADNLFTADPYYQQGGDMVRVGGLRYTLDPTQKIGSRVTAMELDGKPIDAGKSYKVTGWASVAQPLEGTPVWDAVADYLRDKKTVRVDSVNDPVLVNVEGNPGIA
jgi:sulfur-oxidizing protein SoxB